MLLPIESRNDGPVLRVGHHVREDPSQAFEVVVHVGGHERLGPCEALEAHAHGSPHGAACSIGTDHPVELQVLRLSGRSEIDVDDISFLSQLLEARVPQDARARKRKEVPKDDSRELVLPEVQCVCVRCQVRDEPVIHPADVAGELEVLVELVTQGAGLLRIGKQAELIQHLQRGSDVNGGARRTDHVGLALDDGHVGTGLCQA
jgi:hypothetical protein